MKSFEIRTQSDVLKIYALADSLKELFSASLEGLCELMHPNEGEPRTEFDFTKSITIESIDMSALLVDFLSYSLSLMHKNRAIFSKIEIKELDEDYLQGVLHGYNIEEFAKNVKSISFHGAEIFPTIDNKFEVTIVPEIGNILE